MKPELILTSLLLSFAADILFLKTPFELAAVLLFVAVQYCHRCLQNGTLSLFTLIGFLGMFLFLLLASLLNIKSSPLTAAAFFYMTLLCTNLTSSFTKYRQNTPSSLRFCLVMLLACDLHVGLFNLPRFVGSLNSSVSFYCIQIAPNLIWIFYLPGQLIMLYLFFCCAKEKPLSIFL